MKKAFKIVAIFAAMAVMTVSMAACGDSSKEASTASQQPSVVSQDESSEDAESSEEQSSAEESGEPESSADESSEDASSEPESSTDESSEQPQESAASAAENSSSVVFGTFATLDELINQDYMQSMIESQVSSYAAQGITVDVYVEGGTKLVYEGVYDDDVTDETAQAMQEYLEDDSLVSTYESIAVGIQEYVEQPGISVIVRFKDKSGNIVAEKEYFQE